MEKQKRTRNINYSQEETNLLVSLIESKKHVIESKKSDAFTWQEKEKAWNYIEKAYNSGTSVFRDHKHLKLKYEAMKRDVRKKSAIIRSEVFRLGEETDPRLQLTEAEEKVKGILLSVEGDESQFKSDLFLPSISSSSSLSKEFTDEQSEQDPTDMLNFNLQIVKQEIEPPNKKVCLEYQKETSLPSINMDTKNHWNEWRQNEKSPNDKLTEERLEIAKLQKKVILEELEQKIIQRKFFEKEMQHKEMIYELEKQYLLLKIKLLQKELGDNMT